MNVKDLALDLEIRINRVCNAQSRYRVLWIVGEPRCGKTSLCRSICGKWGWRYVNFTLDPGFLDSLIGQEQTYRPENFFDDLSAWCAETSEEILILDEIEPVLSLWNWEQQEIFFKQIGRATGLHVGVVIVTRSRSAQQLHQVLLGMHSDHIYEIAQEQAHDTDDA
jgi:hypothetical protein